MEGGGGGNSWKDESHGVIYIAEFLLLLRDAILRRHLTEDKEKILLLLTNIIKFVYIS